MVLNFTTLRYILLFLYFEIYIVHVINCEWSRSINFSVANILYAIQTCIFPIVMSSRWFFEDITRKGIKGIGEFFHLYSLAKIFPGELRASTVIFHLCSRKPLSANWIPRGAKGTTHALEKGFHLTMYLALLIWAVTLLVLNL